MSILWSIPPFTLDLIARGEAILFLGSGASFNCKTNDNKRAMSGTDLRDALCDKFLGGEGKKRTLAAVGELVKSAAGLMDMQRFVRDTFEPLQPTSAHADISRYRWKAIITTNYDLAIERGYALGKNKSAQRVEPVISDDDNINSILGNSAELVPLLKLHGCVTRANDTELPLILSSSEYARFQNRRTRLFSYLKDWGREHPIVFCGYSIADENVRDILFDLVDGTISHKRFVLCNPDLISAEISMWAGRRIDAVPGTFDQLMEYLHANISDAKLTLAKVEKRNAGSLSKHIAGNSNPSEGLANYLQENLIHIHPGLADSDARPKDFYRGFSEGFSWLLHSLDVSRSIVEELLLETVISADSKTKTELHVLLGYAGSGKSVALKRYCWDAAIIYGKPVFLLADGCEIVLEHLIELYHLINEPIYVCIDAVLDRQIELDGVIRQLKKQSIPIVFICAARTNEWNVEASELNPHISETYDILDLSETEVGELVIKLKKSDCLGYMSKFSLEEAIIYLKSKLQNQLLVALHEATSGKSFAEIAADEYTQIVPSEAQKLYLDICTVHRVGVPVRAGTISRVSGIRLEEFHQRLFKPLEHVVHTQFSPAIGDYVYKSRHPSIATLVFDAAVPGEDARSAQLTRIIQTLNTGYATDSEAVTKLIKAKQLAKDFTDKQLAYAVFRAARDAGLSQEVVDQHLAQFELAHKSGDLPRARHLIDLAIDGSRNNRPAKSTLHVKAAILRRQARESNNILERDKRRQEAKSILDKLIADKRDPHPFVLKADVLIDELEDRLNEPSGGSSRLVSDLLRDIQSVLLQCRQLFSRDAFLSTVESRLASTMNEHPKATSILENAHKTDKHTTFLAIRLSEKYIAEGRVEDAIRVLTETLKAAGPNKDVHLALAECYRSNDEEGKASEIIDHLRRSFSDGDNRYKAQFLYARHQFLFGDRNKASDLFARLQHAKAPPNIIDAATEPVRKDGKVKRFTGVVESVRPTFAFVKCADYGVSAYLSKRQFSGDWGLFQRGTSVTFALSFSFRGPVATHVNISKP